jgi:o-succinylbenzoate---CoA ligase
VTYALPNPVQSAALAAPERTALVYGERSLTWSQLRDLVVERARQLSGGVRPGDIVPVTGPTSVEWVIELHALGWLGAVAAPMSSKSTRRETLQGLEALELGAAVARELAAREAGAHVPVPRERFWALDDARVVVQTSGTTGAANTVALTTAQLAFSAFGSATRLGVLPTDRWLCALPLHHVGGLMILIRAAFQGTCVELHDGFDAGVVVARLMSGDVTHVSLVPTMLERLLDAGPGHYPSNLRAVLVGGAGTRRVLVDRARASNLPVALTWGMTESASQACTSWPGSDRMAPLPFVRIEADPAGVLHLTGPLVRGRHRSADRGAVDSGAVRVDGRADDIIISGGENISPSEVEAVLREHPAVADAAVVGVPDAQWGMRPVAALVARGSIARPQLDEVRAFCRASLSGFKLPDRVVWCDALPRGELGKLSRAAVRSIMEEPG